jgi:hypothetical protein
VVYFSGSNGKYADENKTSEQEWEIRKAIDLENQLGKPVYVRVTGSTSGNSLTISSVDQIVEGE